MKQIEEKTFVSEEIFSNEYDYTFGENKNEKVDFTFVVICSKFLYCQSQIMYKTSPILLP